MPCAVLAQTGALCSACALLRPHAAVTAGWHLPLNADCHLRFNQPPCSHDCSYLCYLSQFTKAQTNDTRCWLSTPPPDTPPRQQCPGFPVFGYLEAI